MANHIIIYHFPYFVQDTLLVKDPSISLPSSGLCQPMVYFLSMQLVFQVHLEIIDTHFWTRGVKFPWTVFALDSRIIHEFYVLWMRLVGPDAYWHICVHRDGSVAHCTLKCIVLIRVLLLEA